MFFVGDACVSGEAQRAEKCFLQQAEPPAKRLQLAERAALQIQCVECGEGDVAQWKRRGKTERKWGIVSVLHEKENLRWKV